MPNPVAMRELNSGEKFNLTTVFRGTISASEVRICSDYSIFNRPYTSAPNFGQDFYTLHVGMNNFSGSLAGSNLLVHELMHVWQGKHVGVNWLYSNSMYHQCLGYLSGESAYLVDEEDLQWSEYNAEQQAAIVAAWFTSGQRWNDWRYRYLVSNIWTRNAYAPSTPLDRKLADAIERASTNSIREIRA